jgi:C4-dicarboxylate-binding protein DctP
MQGASWAFALLLTTLAGALPASAQATLRLSLPISLDSPTGQNIKEFARQVKARTSGALKIDLQGAGRRYDEREIVSVVGAGEIEIGATPLSQLVKHVPLCAAFLQPFLLNFDALIEAATKHEGEIRTLIEKDILERTNTRVLWWEPYGSSVIVSNKFPAGDPMKLLVRRVGATDEQGRALLSTCGSLPRSILASDAYAMLHNGTIEAAATDIMTVKERELWKVADTITNLRYAPSLYLVVINEQTWQGLVPEHQEILTELAQDAQSLMWARFATIRAEAYAFAVQQGMRIVEPSADDVAAWRACSADLLETYMERGGVAVSKLFRAYGRLRADPCCRDAPGEMPLFRQ